MTEGNFTDYVKVYVRSGMEVKDPLICTEKKFVEKGGPDGGDGVEVVILSYGVIKTYGH